MPNTLWLSDRHHMVTAVLVNIGSGNGDHFAFASMCYWTRIGPESGHQCRQNWPWLQPSSGTVQHVCIVAYDIVAAHSTLSRHESWGHFAHAHQTQDIPSEICWWGSRDHIQFAIVNRESVGMAHQNREITPYLSHESHWSQCVKPNGSWSLNIQEELGSPEHQQPWHWLSRTFISDCLPRSMIWSNCTISVLRNGRKCKHIFMFAQNNSIQSMANIMPVKFSITKCVVNLFGRWFLHKLAVTWSKF